jgi:maleylacetate reductase
MTSAFIYRSNPARIVFGQGTLAKAAEEVTGQGCGRALILSTPFQKPDAERLSQQLGRMSVGVFADAAMHTPVEVTERALAAFEEAGADCVVAIGGGSEQGDCLPQ